LQSLLTINNNVNEKKFWNLPFKIRPLSLRNPASFPSKSGLFKLSILRSVGFDGHSMRLMPNVNCAVSSGTLVLSADSETPQELVELVSVLSSYVGKCIRVDEAHFNAASSISGCGPAFVSLFLWTMAPIRDVLRK